MTQIWAHRGARTQAPENTLPAFELAIEQGADGVEFDVQLTADGAMVVIHDETVDRTTDGRGGVVGYTLEQLQRLDASRGIKLPRDARTNGRRSGGKPGPAAHPAPADRPDSAAVPNRYAGVRIPTLDQVLTLLAPAGLLLNIELKNSVVDYPGLEEQVLDAVERFGVAGRTVLSSFNHGSLQRLRALGTTCDLGLLYTDPRYRPWRDAERLGVAAIHPPARFTSARFVRKAHAAGLGVRPWVVNADRQLARMFAWEVAGVFTDVPARARTLRSAVGAPSGQIA